MADFFFYVHCNTVTHKVQIHRRTCGARKDGAGMHEGSDRRGTRHYLRLGGGGNVCRGARNL